MGTISKHDLLSFMIIISVVRKFMVPSVNVGVWQSISNFIFESTNARCLERHVFFDYKYDKGDLENVVKEVGIEAIGKIVNEYFLEYRPSIPCNYLDGFRAPPFDYEIDYYDALRPQRTALYFGDYSHDENSELIVVKARHNLLLDAIELLDKSEFVVKAEKMLGKKTWRNCAELFMTSNPRYKDADFEIIKRMSRFKIEYRLAEFLFLAGIAASMFCYKEENRRKYNLDGLI